MKLFDRSLVCLDLALDRLVVLETSGGRVIRWGESALPRAAMRHGDPVNVGQIGRLLGELIERAGITAKRARVAISDEAAVTRFITPPAMRKRHLLKAVEFMAEREMPFPPERSRLGWDFVSTPAGKGIVLGGAWRDVVDRLVEVTRLAGLKAEVIEPRSVAVGRALSLSAAVVIEGGVRHATVTVLQDHHVVHVEHANWPADRERRTEVLKGLLQAALAAHPISDGAPVVLGGGLEEIDLDLTVEAYPTTHFLNGHRPRRPDNLEAGRFLAALGLAMRR